MERKITYRLRGCPEDLNQAGVSQLLSRALGNIEASDIRIQSLATSLNPYERRPTKVATLTFEKPPTLPETQQRRNEWVLLVDGVRGHLILDTHFLGWTPFNDPEKERHEFDCIGISGLASHPFGSWQPKGGDKSYMWIRDTLPHDMPSTRAIIYGYDTTLHNSNSFQSITDIAKSFAEQLESSGWHLPRGKPLMFLAHSLGGIVLKEAFTLLAKGDNKSQEILGRFRGGIFFGVPSDGMVTSHLYPMVRGQPNTGIIKELSTEDEYLRRLDDRFSGLVSVWRIQMHWAYETRTSPTVREEEEEGTFSRSGPEDVLVTEASATRRPYELYASTTFPIDENHSEMVKFGRGHDSLAIVLGKLQGIRESEGLQSYRMLSNVHNTSYSASPALGTMEDNEPDTGYNIPQNSRQHTNKWNFEDLIRSLVVPGRYDRLDTIDENFEHTFDWVFNEGIGLTSWFKEEGTGMFWVHGKPGSGKSTLMKSIYQSNHFREVLHKLATEYLRISACFFFHDRGTLLQKSFDGLLRSILHQILHESRDLAMFVAQDLRSRYQLPHISSGFWTITTLEQCLRLILRQSSTKLELFLFLDALDEYDGQSEFISVLRTNKGRGN
ncbi:hypothetical protein F5X99DRAFT_394690 [Biscogniauxia marginata]|nr:hypothetical protein F5X99DRAFT_394690 [Biscogniauxia marginata]